MRLSPALLLCAALLLPVMRAEAGVTHVEANRTRNRLILWNGTTQIASFHAAFGSFVAAKQREGDRATPIGRYTLSPARQSQQWRWFMPIDYPNATDVAAGRTGGAIGIHGTGGSTFAGAMHFLGVNWTAGCIAVSNADLETIRTLITSSVPIEISF